MTSPTTAGPVRRYPAGPITPHGAWHLLAGRIPRMWLTGHDNTVQIELLGGKAIPWRTAPEAVHLRRGGIKGLIAPWDTIDQKGATQDGVSFLDALYGPTEVELQVRVVGRDPQHLRATVRDLIGAIDVKRTARLQFFDHDAGHWWADVRWFKTPPDEYRIGQSRSHKMTLVLRADDAFWRSHLDADQFRFTYDAVRDNFNYIADDAALGAHWDIEYYGPGGGRVHVNGKQLAWQDDPLNPVLSEGRTVVMRRRGFTSDTDNQVVESRMGWWPEISFGDNANNALWARMPSSGQPGLDGISLTYEVGWLRLSAWVSGVETVLREQILWLAPGPDEVFTLVCGYDDDPRLFKVLRNGLEIMSVKERGTVSRLGPGYRSVGIGMHAGAALLGQATPAPITRWSAGDNARHAQAGHLECLNIGDQPMYRELTCFGPGIFRIADGPDSTDMIEFGPLLENQVVQIRTDPRRRGVVDLTSIPPTPQQLNWFQQALKDFYTFASGNNISPLEQSIMSQWGIRPPQGNLYSLLSGRFSKASAIPPQPAAGPAKPVFVRCEIVEGTADSKIISTGTPLRRYPL